mmetsp:Transcript_3622/g.4147  ORF Transcript_3622/g.4147 Transcript_3622/m.4147 type:complete len:273 (+) Transcript_3622:804-1622(+)
MPNPRVHPNFFGWAAMAKKFKDDVVAKWAPGQLEIPAGGVEMPKRAVFAAPVTAKRESPYFSGICANLWESILVTSGTQYLQGAKPTQADAAAAKLMGSLKPNPATHPNLFAWAAMISKFSPTVQAMWPAADLPMPASAAATPQAKPTPKAAAAAEADVDEDDLFGGDDDADEAAAALAKKKAATTEKKKKPAPIAKSIVLIEVKPLDDETNLDNLAAKIIAIEKDGLTWKTEYKKEPIAFGIFKLIIGFVVEDIKVSVDNDIIPMLEEWED